jgi:hypothetical protein
MANNANVNYDDKRLTDVKTEEQAALTELESTYSGMIGNVDEFYDKQIQASEDWATEQEKFQNEQTNLTIEQIEQQRAQAQKDYVKEQSGAYVDLQKQSNRYGAEAERQASAGMTGTGFSESSQVSMFNTYQNRVATARDAMVRANMNFDNGIKEAKLQNNAAIAEIKYQALQQQLQLGLEGFQYKNNLILEQTNKKFEMKNMYHSQYMDVLNQINTENAMAEQIRQFNENYAMQLKKFDESVRQFNIEIERLRKKDDEEARQKAEALELKKQQLQQQQKQWEAEMKLKYDQLAEEQRQFDSQMSHKSSGGGGNSGGGGGNSGIIEEDDGGSGAIEDTKYEVDTPYYQGSLNPDAKTYGTFSNGYQPKGIKGFGKVSKTGDTLELPTETLSGHKTTVVQNIWKTPDGTLWYWEGRQNKYIRIGGSWRRNNR